MKAFVFHSPWVARLEECRRPAVAAPDDVVIEVRATGICGTDLGILSGAHPATGPVILGHESAGVVAEAGPAAEGLAPGDRVVIDPTYYCGICRCCTTGRPNHCIRKGETETGVSIDGTFASHYRTKARFVRRLRPGTPFEHAVLVEPTSCALTGLARVGQARHPSAIVLGAGPIGLLYAALLRNRGDEGVIVETSAHRRTVARSILPGQWEVCESLEEASPAIRRRWGQVALAVDTAGCASPEILPLVQSGGTILLVALRRSSLMVDPFELTSRGLSLTGSVDSVATFDTALNCVESGLVPAAAIVDARVPLDRIVEGLAQVGLDLAGRTRTGAPSAVKLVVTSGDRP